jgi:hypothetical protein
MKPLDAVFVSSGGVAVLDAAPPWIKVFGEDGRFVRAIVRAGDGPAEVSRPNSLATDGEGGLLVSHSVGVLRIDLHGQPIQVSPRFRARGAVAACGEVFALSEGVGVPRSSAIVRLGLDGSIDDTLVVLDTIRMDSRTYHPWFVHGDTSRLVFYSERSEDHLLVEYDCGTALTNLIPVDSLGPGTTVELLDGGRERTAPPRPPFPSGLAWLEDRSVWATRYLSPSGDSITEFSEQADDESVAIRGWFQLFDSDREGRFLLGNSWSRGQRWNRGETWGSVPFVAIWDGRALLGEVRR